MHSSVMQYKVFNLGTLDKPQNINLGVQCSDEEKAAFVKLFKEYKDMFAWSYDDLKTFDAQVMQHMIPIKEGVKPIKHNLCKMHPSLDPTVKAELNKLLAARIIFPIWHTQWVANLVPVWKKNGDIRLCVDFQNLKRASNKDSYPVPSMEHMLQHVSGSKMFSLLDGFSRYNQVLVAPEDRLKITFRTKCETYTYQKIPFGLINAGAIFQRAMDIDFRGLLGIYVVV